MAIEPHSNHKLLQDLLDKLNGQNGIENHEHLQGLLGGNSYGHYHLTVDLLNKLINLPVDGGGGGIGSKTENWTFTLDDNSTVTKTVVLA